MNNIIDNATFYFPKTKLSNYDLSQEFNISEEKIFKKTGIKNRYISGNGELASDMAFNAIESFFTTNPHIEKKSIDFLIVCSECFDYIAPNTSCILQDKLNLSKTCGCIDMPYGCSGYVYGLAMAKSFVSSGLAKNVLFVAADTSTKTIPKESLELRSLFSDVASVTYINSQNSNSIGEFVFGTDGSGCHNLYIEDSGFRKSADKIESDKEQMPNGKMIMNGIEIFNFGLRVVPKLVFDTIEKNNLQFNDIDLFVFHQPSFFLLNVLKKKINIPDDKFFCNIEVHGNTVSSSIPLALKDAEKQGKLKKGMTVLLAGFGIGYSWAGTVIKT